MLDENLVQLPNGTKIPLSSGISKIYGIMLDNIIRELKPKICLEVGLGYGVSTLYILNALKQTGGKKLIGIDPVQQDGWQSAGLYNIERAGLSDLYEFHEEKSEDIRPQLKRQGIVIDFAFIDGSHTFDHALIDFYHIDSLLKLGGIIVLDDVGMPAIRKLCEFIVTNRSYEIVHRIENPQGISKINKVKGFIKKILLRVTCSDSTPSPEDRKIIEKLKNTISLAIKKTKNDIRSWDHYVRF